MDSTHPDNPGQEVSAERRSSSWDHKLQAIVYDPSLDKIETVDQENLKSEWDHLASRIC